MHTELRENTLEVGVGPDPFTLTWAEVATVKVPFPETTFLGALSGVQADFGEVKIDGYRLDIGTSEWRGASSFVGFVGSPFLMPTLSQKNTSKSL